MVPVRPNWALFLDIDGTLLDIAERPDAAAVPTGLVAKLEAVAACLDGALALVSGRSVTDIDRLFGSGKFLAAGQHGAELRLVHAKPPQTLRDPLSIEITSAVRDLIAGKEGFIFEDKGCSLSLHYRQAPGDGRKIGAALGDLIASKAPQLEVFGGKMIWEVRDPKFTKGTAVDAMLAAAPFKGRVPVFVGDDTTDADGFRTAVGRGGLAFGVGASAPALASPSFASPAAVRAWIESFPQNIKAAA
jgi:trehalose 6-phosphate phosphatase